MYFQSANWIVTFLTPIMLARSSFAAYYVFGFATLLTVIACAFFMPETKGRSLEAIDKAFNESRSSTTLSFGALRRRVRRRPAQQEEDGVELRPVVSHAQGGPLT